MAMGYGYVRYQQVPKIYILISAFSYSIPDIPALRSHSDLLLDDDS